MKFINNGTHLNYISPDRMQREHCDIPTNGASPECNHAEISDKIKGHFAK